MVKKIAVRWPRSQELGSEGALQGSLQIGKPLPVNESEEYLRFFETGNRLAFFEDLSTLNLTKILDSVTHGSPRLISVPMEHTEKRLT